MKKSFIFLFFSLFQLIGFSQNSEMSVTSFSKEMEIKSVRAIGNIQTQKVTLEFVIMNKSSHKEICMNLCPEDMKVTDQNGKIYLVESGSINNNNFIIPKFCSQIKNAAYTTCGKASTNTPTKCKLVIKSILSDAKFLSELNIKICYRDYDTEEALKSSLTYQFSILEFKNVKIEWK